MSSGHPNQALTKQERVPEQFSSEMNCSHGTTTTEPIPK